MKSSKDFDSLKLLFECEKKNNERLREVIKKKDQRIKKIIGINNIFVPSLIFSVMINILSFYGVGESIFTNKELVKVEKKVLMNNK